MKNFHFLRIEIERCSEASKLFTYLKSSEETKTFPRLHLLEMGVIVDGDWSWKSSEIPFQFLQSQKVFFCGTGQAWDPLQKHTHIRTFLAVVDDSKVEGNFKNRLFITRYYIFIYFKIDYINHSILYINLLLFNN